jgi:hypothetical protein
VPKKTTSPSSPTRAKKVDRPAEDKAVRGPAETKKGPRRRQSLEEEQAALEHNATFEGTRDDRQHLIRKCFNPSCPDYGVERRGGEPCECRSVGGANHR